MQNLYEETINALDEAGKTVNDVKYIVSWPLFTDWKHFELNSKFYYDDGFGNQEINSDLKIVGDNWWLERAEYDGSEWWSYKEYPNIDLNFIQAKPHQIMDMIKGGF